MPVAHWKTFADCENHMKTQEGYSEESAKKVCGKLEQVNKAEPSVKEWEFNPNEILASPRKVQGIFHQPIVDKDGEMIQSSGMRKAVPDFMHLPVLHDFHKERPVGVATKIKELSGGRFWFEGVLKATKDVDDIWEKVKTGNYDQVSIFGKRTKYNNQCSLPQSMRSGPCITDGVRLDSISVCDENARNPQTSLEVMKAKVVYDTTPQWGRDSEGNFVEIMKSLSDRIPSEHEGGSIHGLSKLVAKRNRDMGSAIKDTSYAQSVRKLRVEDKEEKKAETTSSNLQHASTDYADEKDMEKGFKLSHKGKTADAELVHDTRRLARISNKIAEPEEEEAVSEGMKNLHKSKARPRKVRVTVQGTKRGDNPSSNLGLVDYKGESSFKPVKKCPCPKQEANTISKEVEKANPSDEWNEDKPTKKESTSGHNLYDGTAGSKVHPKSNRNEAQSPHEKGGAGRASRDTNVPYKRPEEERSTGAEAIMHYGAEASHKKFGNKEEATEHHTGQLFKPRTHKAKGEEKVKFTENKDKEKTKKTEDAKTHMRQTFMHKHEEQQSPKERKESAGAGLRNMTKEHMRKGDDEGENMSDEEMEKGRTDRIPVSRNGTVTQHSLNKVVAQVHNKKRNDPNASQSFLEDTKTEHKLRTQGMRYSDEKHNEHDTSEQSAAMEGMRNLHKGAAEDLADENYDEDEDKDFKHAKPTDKEGRWSKDKDPNGTVKMTKAKKMEDEDSAEEVQEEEYEEEEKEVKDKSPKKNKGKGVPAKHESEVEEEEKDEEEEEKEVEKGSLSENRRGRGNLRGKVNYGDHAVKYGNVADEDIEPKGRTGKTPSRPLRGKAMEDGHHDNVTKLHDYPVKHREPFEGHTEVSWSGKPDSYVKLGPKMSTVKKGDEDTASELFDPSTVKKGEHMVDETETEDVEYVTKALVPIEEIDTIVKARTEEISKAYMGQLDEIKKAYDAKFVELSSQIEKMENETIRKGGSVIVIPELLKEGTGAQSNADAVAQLQAGRR